MGKGCGTDCNPLYLGTTEEEEGNTKRVRGRKVGEGERLDGKEKRETGGEEDGGEKGEKENEGKKEEEW